MRLGIVGDIHLAPAGTQPERWHNAFDFAGAVERLTRAVELFDGEALDAVVVLGDVAHLGDDASLDEALAILARSAAPVWVAAGNHDIARSAGALAAAQRRLPGPWREGDGVVAVLAIASSDGGASCRAVSEAVGAEGAEPVLLASHFPLISRRAELAAAGLRYSGDLDGRERLLEALSERSVPSVVLSGHLHVRDSAACGPVLQLLFPALVEHPFECAIAELDRSPAGWRFERAAIPLHEAPFEADPRLTPQAERWQFDGSTWRRR